MNSQLDLKKILSRKKVEESTTNLSEIGISVRSREPWIGHVKHGRLPAAAVRVVRVASAVGAAIRRLLAGKEARRIEVANEVRVGHVAADDILKS